MSRVNKNTTALGTLLVLGALACPAGAAPLIFFGEDLGAGEDTRLASHPNADAARNSFLANLVGVGTETFESFAPNSTPPALSFPGAGTATLVGSGSIVNVPTGTNGFGRYPISGNQFFETDSSMQINFSDPVAAFGFYGVDIGDFDGEITLTFVNGGSTTIDVGNSTNISGGSVLYFGYIDEANPFTSIIFGNTSGGDDTFAFDDMTIGSVEQVQVPVPEPASLALLASALIGIAVVRRRRRD